MGMSQPSMMPQQNMGMMGQQGMMGVPQQQVLISHCVTTQKKCFNNQKLKPDFVPVVSVWWDAIIQG